MVQDKYLNDNKITHFFGEVSDGNMSYNYGDEKQTAENLNKFINQYVPHAKLIFGMSVEHKDKIIEIKNYSRTRGLFNNGVNYLECDCLITSKHNIALFLAPADCLPLILTNKARTFVALTHLGWKGTDISLPSKIVEFIKTSYETNPTQIEALIGPTIRQKSFIYKGFSPKNMHNWSEFIEVKANGFQYIDNVGAAMKQLIESGILTENIHDSEINTFEDARFFSHSEDYHNGVPDRGRFGVFTLLK